MLSLQLDGTPIPSSSNQDADHDVAPVDHVPTSQAVVNDPAPLSSTFPDLSARVCSAPSGPLATIEEVVKEGNDDPQAQTAAAVSASEQGSEAGAPAPPSSRRRRRGKRQAGGQRHPVVIPRPPMQPSKDPLEQMRAELSSTSFVKASGGGRHPIRRASAGTPVAAALLPKEVKEDEDDIIDNLPVLKDPKLWKPGGGRHPTHMPTPAEVALRNPSSYPGRQTRTYSSSLTNLDLFNRGFLQIRPARRGTFPTHQARPSGRVLPDDGPPPTPALELVPRRRRKPDNQATSPSMPLPLLTSSIWSPTADEVPLSRPPSRDQGGSSNRGSVLVHGWPSDCNTSETQTIIGTSRSSSSSTMHLHSEEEFGWRGREKDVEPWDGGAVTVHEGNSKGLPHLHSQRLTSLASSELPARRDVDRHPAVTM
jgi:hypothetical protein